MEWQQCTQCKILKPFSDFYRLHTLKDGHQSRCKKCDGLLKRKWRETHREQARNRAQVYRRLFRQRHPEEYRAYRKRWIAKHPETVKAQRQRYYRRHRESLRENKRQDWLALRKECLKAYGNQCVCCGIPDTIFLTIDHIDGKGNEHRRNLKQQGFGKTGIYKFLKSQGWPKTNYRILCWNCNHAVTYNRTCPHQVKVSV